jgi:hypothetical protein
MALDQTRLQVSSCSVIPHASPLTFPKVFLVRERSACIAKPALRGWFSMHGDERLLGKRTIGLISLSACQASARALAWARAFGQDGRINLFESKGPKSMPWALNLKLLKYL